MTDLQPTMFSGQQEMTNTLQNAAFPLEINQLGLQREFVKGQMEISKRNVITEQTEACKARYQENRLRLKEAIKRQYDELIIGKNGNVTMVTRNPVFSEPAVSITNMKSPQVFALDSIYSNRKKYCILCCYVNNEITHVYLDRSRLTKGGYLLGKLSAAGITWTIKTSTKAVHLFTQLITELINYDDEKIFLPEDIGWQILDSGELKYVEEGELTWKKIIEWAK